MENEVEQKKQRKKSNIFKETVTLLLEIAVLLLIVFCINRYVAQRTVVNGSSMETTLSNNDNLIVDKLSYKFSDPKRFDIIIFPHGGVYYIKRIIGMPGETIKIDETDGSIYINGQRLNESFGYETMDYAGIAADGITLKDDEYFCLGDNRNNSEDSRFVEVGPVKADTILGKAIYKVYPFEESCKL